jgi:putative phage-type endonuclease
MLRKRVKGLQKKPQPEQRTEAWFLQRQTKVTASEAASCLYKTEKVCGNYVKTFNLTNFKYNERECVNPYETREDYIIKKCSAFYGENVFRDTPHTMWGKKYEEVATRLYRCLKQTRVIEFGLLNHSRLKWLAASPDGITEDGIMLEIKCPKSRKIDPRAPTFYYYVQMQIQLECTNLEECDFLECELKEFDTEEEWKSFVLEKDQYRGIVLGVPDNFIYPPDNLETETDFIQWRKTYPNIPASYYVIHKYNIIRVKRDKEWFQNVKCDIKEVWEIIQKLQKNKSDFEKYKESIHTIKSKSYIELYNKTECLIPEDTEGTFTLGDENKNEKHSEMEIDVKCLIESTE